MLESITNTPDEDIPTADFNELIEYYTEKFCIHPLFLYLEHVYETLEEVQIHPNGMRIYTVEGYRVTYYIPFSGDSRLLDLYPLYSFRNTLEVDDIKKTDDPAIRTIIFSLEYTKDELEKKLTPEFKSNEFLRAFKRYIEVIDEIKKRIEEFNARLPDLIIKALAKRKQKVDDYIALSKVLSIPLERNPNAPNIISIPLEMVIKKPSMPDVSRLTRGYTISDADYENIRKIIGLAGFSMEKTAATFNKMTEDALRNVMVAFLNTHYLGTVTGETFCKTGRADIHILFENKAAYIAECKVWDSERCLDEAINQLFNYTTWHDVKTSLIIFNKTLKNFMKLRQFIYDYIYKNLFCRNIKSINENEWLCEFKQSVDSTDYITIHIIVFNLYLSPDKSKEASICS